VIPTFNCAPQIGGLIEALAPFAGNWEEIWFVDNVSTDETIDALVSKLNIFPIYSSVSKVFLNSENIGLGGTHKIVFKKAIAENFETLTIFHGDHQATVEDAKSALMLARENPGVFILGSRFSRTSRLVGYSKLRTIFNHFMNLYYSLILRRRIRDLGSGLNIFPLHGLRNLDYQKLPNDLTFNIEFLKWLISASKNIRWLPITWIEKDQISNVRVFTQVLKTFKLALLPFGSMGESIPQDFFQRQVKSHDK
jgi:glycosyltransferase involved in cell wall biosynthesis